MTRLHHHHPPLRRICGDAAARARLIHLAALCAVAAALLACGDDGGGDGGGGAGQGGEGPCGTLDDPLFFTLKDILPAPGSSVPNQDIVHGFTIVDAPGLLKNFSFASQLEHNAGTRAPSITVFEVFPMGSDLRYESMPLSWENAPAEVSVVVLERYDVGGCFWALPEPLFRYSVTVP